MKCFSCSTGDKSDGPKPIKSPLRSFSTSVSADPEAKKSGSEFNSLDGSDISGEFYGRKSFSSLSQKPSTLTVYSVNELKTATKNFSRSLMLGEGGFGGVYRGVVPDAEHSKKKIDIAVKQLSKRGLQGHKEWVTEVNVLGIVEHQNLVKLIGYGAEDDERGIERLLVYEYMPNRSVLDHLSSRCRTPLPWATRLKIAQDAARGLAYLHGNGFPALTPTEIDAMMNIYERLAEKKMEIFEEKELHCQTLNLNMIITTKEANIKVVENPESKEAKSSGEGGGEDGKEEEEDGYIDSALVI